MRFKPPVTLTDWAFPAIVVAALIAWVAINFHLFNPPVGYGAARLEMPAVRPPHPHP